MQFQVGLYFLSNSFLRNAAMSFSMLNFSMAWKHIVRKSAVSPDSHAPFGGLLLFIILFLVSSISHRLVHPFLVFHARSTHRQCTLHSIFLHVVGHVGVDDGGLELRCAFGTHFDASGTKDDLQKVRMRLERRRSHRRRACKCRAQV